MIAYHFMCKLLTLKLLLELTELSLIHLLDYLPIEETGFNFNQIDQNKVCEMSRLVLVKEN